MSPGWEKNLSERLQTQNTAPKADACTSTAPARAGEQESITGLAEAGLLWGWRAARCRRARGTAPGAARGLSAAHLPAGTPCGPPRRADVQTAGGEDAWEPLESPAMNALVNQGHSSAPPALLLRLRALFITLRVPTPGEFNPRGANSAKPAVLSALRLPGATARPAKCHLGARMLSGGLSLLHLGPSRGPTARPQQLARGHGGPAAHPGAHPSTRHRCREQSPPGPSPRHPRVLTTGPKADPSPSSPDHRRESFQINNLKVATRCPWQEPLKPTIKVYKLGTGTGSARRSCRKTAAPPWAA